MSKKKYCIFAGTSDGRALADYLKSYDIDITICVATEYGASVLDYNISCDNISVLVGRMNQSEMEQLFTEHSFDTVVDCTHPYAQVVTENICAATTSTGTNYLRVNRETSDYTNCIAVPDTQCAVEYLAQTEGNIMLTTGSKELRLFADCGYKERIFARVLPFVSSLEECAQAGIVPTNIIAMQGPFTHELNKAMFLALDIKVMVTKNSGRGGGFFEKVLAAQELGITTIVISPPPQVKGVSLSQAMQSLAI